MRFSYVALIVAVARLLLAFELELPPGVRLNDERPILRRPRFVPLPFLLRRRTEQSSPVQ